jgi:hypothetical protein
VGAGVQLLPLPLRPPAWLCLSPLPGHAGLAVARARSACGGAAAVDAAAAVVAAAPTGVARTPALCVVRAHLSLRSFALAHLPSLSPLFVRPRPHPVCPLARLPVRVVPGLSHTGLVSRAGPCCSCLRPLSFVLRSPVLALTSFALSHASWFMPYPVSLTHPPSRAGPCCPCVRLLSSVLVPLFTLALSFALARAGPSSACVRLLSLVPVPLSVCSCVPVFRGSRPCSVVAH